MRPSFPNGIFLAVAWAVLLVAGGAAAADRELRSPPLAILGNRSFSLVAPAGWQVASREPASGWRLTAYDFTLAPDRPNPLAEGPLGVEILQHAIGRARLHGDLRGRRFRSRGGQRGFLNTAEFTPGTRDWYFAVPVPSTQSALIVRVMFKRGGRRTLSYEASAGACASGGQLPRLPTGLDPFQLADTVRRARRLPGRRCRLPPRNATRTPRRHAGLQRAGRRGQSRAGMVPRPGGANC